MVKWQINLWVLCLSVVFTSASYTMLIPFLPVYLLEIGVGEADVALWSGAIFSISFFIGAIMAPIWGKIADKSGKRLMLLRAGFGLAIVYLLGGLVTSPEQLFAVRLLQGFANGFVPAALAIVSSSAPKEKLGMSLGVMQTGQIIGAVVGPLLGGTLAHVFGMRISFFIAGGFLLLVTALVMVLVKEPIIKRETQSAQSVYADLKVALSKPILAKMLGLTVIVQLAVLILQPVVTLYVADIQDGAGDAVLSAGLIFSLGGLAGAFSAPFWGRFGQRKGYLTAMAIAFCGAGFFNLLQYFPRDVWLFGVLQFCFGLFIVGVHPSISAVLVNGTEPNFRGRIFGIATTAHQLGSMLGPILGSLITASLGMQYVFLFTGILLLIIGLAVWREQRHMKLKKVLT